RRLGRRMAIGLLRRRLGHRRADLVAGAPRRWSYRRVGRRRDRRLDLAASAARTPWALAGAVAIDGVFSGILFPRFFAELTTAPPPALRARVMTTVTVAISAPAPLGFLGAGLLAQRTGSTVPSLLLVAVAATLGALIIRSAAVHEPVDGHAVAEPT
ncbi:MAG TPA: hypothetical protein VGQ26_09950, partial [Streptosporangiaceae bacterium]|nr:hypothetical protein [Streptosporangiaceae bacterium]